MDMFERLFKRTKATVILMGVALLVLGVAMFVSLLIVRVVGWTLAIVGAVTLANCWRHSSEGLRQADLFMGLLEAIPGVCLIMWPDAFVAVVYVLIGIIVLVTGVNDVIEANVIRRALGVGWRMVIGVVTLLAGAAVVASPFAMAELVMLVAGLALVFDGITEIIAGVSMRELP